VIQDREGKTRVLKLASWYVVIYSVTLFQLCQGIRMIDELSRLRERNSWRVSCLYAQFIIEHLQFLAMT
jgi:hypothetical protein